MFERLCGIPRKGEGWSSFVAVTIQTYEAPCALPAAGALSVIMTICPEDGGARRRRAHHHGGFVVMGPPMPNGKLNRSRDALWSAIYHLAPTFQSQC